MFHFYTYIFLTILTVLCQKSKVFHIFKFFANYFLGPVSFRTCSNKYDCGEFGYICGHNQTCGCDRFYVLNSYGDKCVGGACICQFFINIRHERVAGVGQRCIYDEHCIEGAFCQYQVKCECKNDLYPSENGLVCSSNSTKVTGSRKN